MGEPMTDLYEALRAAMTPDGRVRLTRELLTAMHEEGERRRRGESVEVWRERAFAAEGALTVRLAVRREIEEALGMVPGLTDDQALQRGLDAVRSLRERAETAERELEGAEREADEQRERRKRAEAERDAAHQRAEKAERERDEARVEADGLRSGQELGRAFLVGAAARVDALIAHARACLDPEIVSRDPAHARLAALLERIESR